MIMFMDTTDMIMDTDMGTHTESKRIKSPCLMERRKRRRPTGLQGEGR